MSNSNLTHFPLKDPRFESLVFPLTVAATLSDAANDTYTVAEVLGGLILRDTNGAARTDTLPDAADLLAAIPGAIVGTSFKFTVRNTADAAETLTVAAGAGGTISGTATIAESNSKEFLVVFTDVDSGSEAYTVYSLGTATF